MGGHGNHVFHRIQLFGHAGFPAAVVNFVEGDLDQPGRQPGPPVEPVDRPERLDVGFLNDVFGIRVAGHQIADKAVQQPVMGAHDGFERRVVAGAGLVDDGRRHRDVFVNGLRGAVH